MLRMDTTRYILTQRAIRILRLEHMRYILTQRALLMLQMDIKR